MQRRAAKLATNIDKTVRRVAIVADREIVMATPVDTGRARSNWLVTVGSPRSDVIEPYSEHTKGSGGGGSGAGESANAQAAINQGMLAIGSRKMGQAIFIQNNVPYINKLNAGSSKQAPANFVRISVMNAVKIVQKLKGITS